MSTFNKLIVKGNFEDKVFLVLNAVEKATSSLEGVIQENVINPKLKLIATKFHVKREEGDASHRMMTIHFDCHSDHKDLCEENLTFLLGANEEAVKILEEIAKAFSDRPYWIIEE